jgi:hypothetical protein
MITRDSNHIYRNEKGETYISVTQQLKIYGLIDFSMVRKEDLDYAAERGSHVHHAHYLYLLDDLVVDSLDESYKGYVKAIIKFYKEQNIEVWDSESIVYSDKLRTGGSFDLMCSFNGYGSVVEFKTPVVMPKTTGLQTAAYKMLWNESKPQNFVVHRYGVQLFNNGRYKIHKYENQQDKFVFANIAHTNWYALSNRIIPVGAKSDPDIYAICKEIVGK